ncbi:MAG TPA: hypothetical protein VKQ30_01570 [Ktedonobacterales bacterium]|nr:hypothetical protein [Ktedonobacterales bacterium]
MERSVLKRKVNAFLLFIPLVLLYEMVPALFTSVLAPVPEDARETVGHVAIFVLAALSLIPLAGFVESAVEELAELLGPFIGGLLHTTFGNVAELTIGLSVLLSFAGAGGGEIVRGSIAGVIIRNSLLFLGLSTLAGCWRNGHMKFDAENASEYSTVFALAVVGLSLPTIGNLVLNTNGDQIHDLAIFKAYPLSAYLAVVLLISYLAYIFFTVFRFREGYNLVETRKKRRADRRQKRQARKRGASSAEREFALVEAQLDTQALFSQERESAERRIETLEAEGHAPAPAPEATRTRTYARAAMLEHRRKEREARGEEGLLAGHPVWRGLIAVVVLAIATAGVAAMSESFAKSIEELISANHALKDKEFFLGLILIPVLAGFVEFYGSIDAARKNRMEITMAVTAGATIQMILLVVPILVIVGQVTGHPLALIFKPIEIIIFGASTFIFMLLSRDGESTWLEGVQLCTVWLLLAVVAIFLPPALVGG